MTIFQQFLDNMGDHDYGARRKLDSLEMQVAGSADSSTVANLAQRLARAERQIAQLTLGCAALGKLLEMKGIAPEEALVSMMQQLDLLDGVEDGSMGGRISADSPRCTHCNHFISPKRTECVYCGRSLTAADGSGPYRGGPSAPPVATVQCTKCQEQTPQTNALFNGDGELVCAGCA